VYSNTVQRLREQLITVIVILSFDVLFIIYSGQGRRQKIFQGGKRKKDQKLAKNTGK